MLYIVTIDAQHPPAVDNNGARSTRVGAAYGTQEAEQGGSQLWSAVVRPAGEVELEDHPLLASDQLEGRGGEGQGTRGEGREGGQYSYIFVSILSSPLHGF